MKHLIDKDAIIAEINRVLNSYDPNEITSGRYALVKLRDFLDTLEVKEVDLEKEIKRFTMSKELYEANSVIKAVAEHFFELGLNKARNIWHDISEKLPTGVIVVNNGGNLHIGWSTDEGDGIEDEHGRLITKTYQKWAREKDLT